MPDIFELKGGIQVYCAFLLQALEQVLPGSDRHVFLKNDAKATDDFHFNLQTKFNFVGQYKLSLFHTSIFALRVLYAALTKKPDLIICGHINFSPLALQVFNLLKIPYWVIIHGVDAWTLTDKHKIKALKSASKIISVSQYTKNRVIQEQNMTPDLITLLPNTFDAGKFTIQLKPQYLFDRYQLDSNNQIILTVTRLSQSDGYKGYDQIIQALPTIRQQIPNIHYLLVGKGDDRDRIEKLIKDHHLQDFVTLTGFVPDHELNDHYNLCDVFAMPSKGEGFGIVYLEALACGKPTIGGNQDGAIDALCNGELGILIDPDNIDQIAQAIVDILQGNHPLSILYQPDLLRQKVIAIYGLDKSKERLALILSDQFPHSI
jgi:glycosyltransferase involved in cell wall biosynthesis